MIYRSKETGWMVAILTILLLMPTGRLLSADSLTVVLIGNYRGRLLGCGCDAINSGGLPRNASVIMDKLNGKIQMPVGFDAGRFLDLDPDKGKTASRCTVLGMAKLGLTAIGVTPRDMFYGVPFLRQTAQSAQVSLLSANMTDSEGNLLFERWLTVKAKSDASAVVTIAVTSLSAFQEGERFTNAVTSWRVKPVPEVMDGLRSSKPKGDVTILLTDMGERDLREFFDKDETFDIIVSTSRQLYTPAPFLLGKTIVASPALDGRNLEGFRIGLTGGTVSSRAVWFAHILAGRVDENPDMLKFLNDCNQGQ